MLRRLACMCPGCWSSPVGSLSLSIDTQRNSRCHGNLGFITISARSSVVSDLQRKRSYYLQSHMGEASFDQK